MKKLSLVIIYLLLLLPVSLFAQELQGIGYGNTTEEAKEEALADLSSAIKVQVFSKHEQTTIKSNDKVSSDYTRWTKLSTNVPLISPSIYYSKENGKRKATAVLDKPELYSDKLSSIAEKIDTITKDVKQGGDKSLNYRLLTSVQPLYDEYESYQVVADVLGIDYRKPQISSAQALNMLLELQTAPPSLEVAAEVLTKEMNEKNIYVVPVLYAGRENITEFGAFFKDMLSTKVNSVEVEEDASNKVPKQDAASILNSYTPPKTDYKLWIKISTDGDASFLRENEPFSLLVKANKPGYVYFLTVNNSDGGEANVLLLDWNNKFIKYIDKDHVNKWVSLGQFRVHAPFGSETLYAFGLEKEPLPEYIVPEYTLDKIGYLRNVRPEVLMQDMLYLFKRQQGDKTMTSITYSTAPNRKKVK